MKTALSLLLLAFLALLYARLVLDVVQQVSRSFRPKGVAVVLFEAAYTVTDPPYKALRRVLPPLRVGTVAVDLAFIVLLVLVFVLQRVVAQL